MELRANDGGGVRGEDGVAASTVLPPPPEWEAWLLRENNCMVTRGRRVAVKQPPLPALSYSCFYSDMTDVPPHTHTHIHTPHPHTQISRYTRTHVHTLLR